MNIKRYNLVIVKEKDGTIYDCGMYEREDGVYVKLKDIDKLISELYLKYGPDDLKKHIEKKISS